MKSLPHLQALEWNHQDKLVRVKLDLSGNLVHYNYDGGGQRTRKTITKNGLKQKERLYLGLVERYQEYDNNGVVTLERWTLQVEGLAQVDTLTVRHAVGLSSPRPVARYQYRDRLGSSTIECNEHGEVISYEEYYPYGSSAYRAAASGVDLSLKRYRFTGKERDEETGLDYFGVRYYASWLGRWTSGDPGGFVDGLNLYRYALNNPVNGIDQKGYNTEPPPGYNDALQNAIDLYGSDGYNINASESTTYDGVSTASITISNGVETINATFSNGAWTHSVTETLRGDGGDIPGGTFGYSGKGLPLTLKTAEGPEVTVTPEGGNIETISTGSFIGDLLVGEIPFVGTGVDLANASIDFHNGDYVMAGLNAAAAIPLLGLLFGSIAKGMKFAKALDKAVDATDNFDEVVTFYHGTTKQGAEAIRKNGVDVSRSVPSKDFGSGFYTSTNYDLAKRSPVNRVPGVNSIDDVHVVSFDIPKFELDNLSSLHLKPNTQEFADFARFHKTHGPINLQHGGKLYDTVTGPLVRRVSKSKGTVNHFENFYGITPALQTSFHTKASERLLNFYMKF